MCAAVVTDGEHLMNKLRGVQPRTAEWAARVCKASWEVQVVWGCVCEEGGHVIRGTAAPQGNMVCTSMDNSTPYI